MEILSLIVGIVSIVLAIVSMVASKRAEQQSLHNFERTQVLLAEIDKKAAVIDSVVQRNQEQMMDTLTNIVNETIIPKKRNYGEEIGAQFLLGLLNGNAENAQNSINTLGALADLMEKFPNQKNDTQNQ